jgi:hypothetical protein
MHNPAVISKTPALPESLTCSFVKVGTNKIYRRYKSLYFNQENIQKTAKIFYKNRSLSRAVLSWHED